jgi:hypothetical protein
MREREGCNDSFGKSQGVSAVSSLSRRTVLKLTGAASMAVEGAQFVPWNEAKADGETSSKPFKIQLKAPIIDITNGASNGRPALVMKCLDTNDEELVATKVYSTVKIIVKVSSTRRPDNDNIIKSITLSVDGTTGKLSIAKNPNVMVPYELPSGTGFTYQERIDGIALILVEDWFTNLYYSSKYRSPYDFSVDLTKRRVFNMIGFADAAWNEEFIVNAVSVSYSSLAGAPDSKIPHPRNNVWKPMEERCVIDRSIGNTPPNWESTAKLSGSGRFIAGSIVPDCTDASNVLLGAETDDKFFPAIMWRGADGSTPGNNDRPNDLQRESGVCKRFGTSVTDPAVCLIWGYLSFCSTAAWSFENGDMKADKAFEDAFLEAKQNGL